MQSSSSINYTKRVKKKCQGLPYRNTLNIRSIQQQQEKKCPKLICNLSMRQIPYKRFIDWIVWVLLDCAIVKFELKLN